MSNLEENNARAKIMHNKSPDKVVIQVQLPMNKTPAGASAAAAAASLHTTPSTINISKPDLAVSGLTVGVLGCDNDSYGKNLGEQA